MDSISRERERERAFGQTGIDLSINEPGAIDTANCIKRKYDTGISRHKGEGAGVCEVTELDESE